MGGCESCASSRRKEVERLIEEARGGRCSNDLKDAIQKAEEMGMDVLPARQQYAELAKLERQSPDRAQEMLRWALSTQDGVVLLNVIQEVSVINPQSTGLRPARRKLVEFQADATLRLQKLVKCRDAPKVAVVLERARQMGIPASELIWAELALQSLEESSPARAESSIPAPELSTTSPASTASTSVSAADFEEGRAIGARLVAPG